MASSIDFVQYIVDQCSEAGEVVAKKMFGDYGIYCNGKIFGLICDDKFYLKPTEEVRSLLRTIEFRPPYDGAKDYFYIADVDNREYLSRLVRETCKVLPEPKSKRKKKAWNNVEVPADHSIRN
jgi:TfoX/Sxy family transcriptional regulator of competence genes